jgi:hypothetical protein
MATDKGRAMAATLGDRDGDGGAHGAAAHGKFYGADGAHTAR